MREFFVAKALLLSYVINLSIYNAEFLKQSMQFCRIKKIQKAYVVPTRKNLNEQTKIKCLINFSINLL